VTSSTASKQGIEEASDRKPSSSDLPHPIDRPYHILAEIHRRIQAIRKWPGRTGSGGGYSDDAGGSPDIVYAVHACRAKARCQVDCFGQARRTF
jgi:hypothetical protein